MLNLIFVEKPSGFNSHQSHPGRDGFVEYLHKIRGEKFHLVSRLDQGTSGAMVLPKDAATAEIMTGLFQKHQVAKRYLFLTDHQNLKKNFTARSHISKQKNTFVSTPEAPNAETDFSFLHPLGPYYLWQAQPKTGKAHQIRLHAQQMGIPVLGDREHGGTEFYRLCLHCQNLKFVFDDQTYEYEARPPVWTTPASVDDWIFSEAQQKRVDLKVAESTSYRLIHQEKPSFRIDIFGPQAWAYHYGQQEDPTTWAQWQQRLGRPLLVKQMANRGQDPQAGKFWTFGDFKEIWQAEENGLDFEFRATSGQSPGLFLDQRENRLWVRKKAANKSVLNLFSYTGGFSLAAAAGGATQVSSVDVSKTFLEWTQKNFALNKLSPGEVWESDAVFFLKAAARRKRQWDLIVCDPPSFGRSREGVFKIEKDLDILFLIFESQSLQYKTFH